MYGDCCDDYAMYCGGGGGGGGSPGAVVPELGTSPSLEVLATRADGLDVPRDLEFHPDRPNELWTVNQATDGTVILFDPGTSSQRVEARVDAFANHFMEEVSSMAFGAADTFGTCQESRNTYDDRAPPNDHMGPSLWPADLDIYASVNQDHGGPLGGSHLDMLHQSPLCMGIAHDRANVYWVFDGLHGDIVRYDFQVDHGPGYSDHSDGIVRRFRNTDVRRVAGVPSHLELDDASGLLYIADTGNGRVLRMDTRTGHSAYALMPWAEPLEEYTAWEGETVETLATGFDAPSGIALHEGRLFVSDAGTGEIVALDASAGGELGRIDTGGRGIFGLTVGPDGKLYFVNGVDDVVVRVDP
jgi:sugar lactone lactonase YvrE